MVKKITKPIMYFVCGDASSYDDHVSWTVGVFATKEGAEIYRAKLDAAIAPYNAKRPDLCERWIGALTRKSRHKHYAEFEHFQQTIQKKMSKLDPEIEFGSGSHDVKYFIKEVYLLEGDRCLTII